MENLSPSYDAFRQSSGSLMVELTSNPLAGPLFPIRDASVLIKELTMQGTLRIVAELITNSSGQTPYVELFAPPIQLSLEPQDKIMPYATYVVEVQARDYVPVIINGVQIFSGIRSILPVTLSTTTLSTSSASTSSSIIFNIGPSILWGEFSPKIPEAEIKDTSAPGFVTLNSVSLPDIIVVHGGTPNNIYVPTYMVFFRDYIKAVASSILYPTWPKETLIANIIAIISFTLNRVYTQWYRNQGKNFTVTSSTAFDQGFFYGRNIFEPISRLVDAYFDTYLIRPGITQPLLALYCNGVRSTCPEWLSQWGSKTLGDEGKTFEEILKFYYGQNLILSEVRTSPIPETSFLDFPLDKATQGADILKVQTQLNRIANHYPLIPRLIETATLDFPTESAIKSFQTIFHLEPTGTIDKATWYKINFIHQSITKTR